MTVPCKVFKLAVERPDPPSPQLKVGQMTHFHRAEQHGVAVSCFALNGEWTPVANTALFPVAIGV